MSKVSLIDTNRLLLLVNDNLTIDQERFQSLTTKGTLIVSSQSTEKAMNLLKRAQFDAVLTDLRRIEDGRKNDTAGIELTQRIRQFNQVIPIFIYSINISFSTRQYALSCGATLITEDPKELHTTLKKYSLL